MAKRKSQPAVPLAFTVQVHPQPQAQVNLPQFSTGGNSPIAVMIQQSQARATQGILGTRGGRNLGPMGFMPNELVIALEMDTLLFTQYQSFAKYMNRNFQETEILHIIQQNLYDPLRIMLFQLINSIVPQDSGRLRNAMELSVAGGRTGQGGSHSMTSSLHPFFVVVNTGKVEYAPVVNQMSTPMLQHFGFSHRNRLSTRYGRTVKPDYAKGGHHLYDPQAITHWYEEILTQGRTRAQQLWLNLSGNAGPLANLIQPVSDYYAALHPVPVFINPNQLIQSLFFVRYG
jgi:hypothetical protein